MSRHSICFGSLRAPSACLVAGFLAAGVLIIGYLASGLPALAEPMGATPDSAAVSPTSSETETFRRELRRLVAESRDRVFPALVNIDVEQVAFYGGREIRGRSVGSGTIFTEQGHVLTNYHVTAGGKEFTCTLSDRQEVPAILVGEDPLTDLAVLQLDLTAMEGDLAVAAFGQSSSLEVGDHVLAMGSPFALSRSVTLGIVSNVERVFGGGMLGTDDPEEMQLGRGERTGLFTRWIQHDALINPGNSGGPLVSLKGEVVGVNELGSGSMGFAIPSDLAWEVAAALIKHGEVPRSRIGATFKTLPPEDPGAGALVASIEENGPAARAGLRAGDLLIALDGEPVALEFPEEVPSLMKRIADQAIGSPLEMTFRREAGTETITVVTERLSRDRGKEVAFRSWGFSVQELTPRLTRQSHLVGKKGVLVSGVRPGGPAQLAEPPLAAGDLLLSLHGRAISSIEDLIDVSSSLAGEKEAPPSLLAEFDRRGKNYLTVLKPELGRDQERPRELPKAWLGAATQPLLKVLSERLGLEGLQGFRVTRVYPFSEAAAADLEVGDVIVGLNGEVLAPRGMQDSGLLGRRIQSLGIGETVRLSVMREGEAREVTVTLDRSRVTPQEARRDRNKDFELVVREVTFFDRDDRSWSDEVKGVLVDSVDPAGWAGRGGLRPGDLLQRIDDLPIRGLKSFRQALESVDGKQPERVTVLVLRGNRVHFHFLEPDWHPIAVGQEAPAS
ncbi:MAG: PDZ domain-containing protein [Deltaproteobacteria bacterium]|nr:PDZ domain-containing protein [Deltaproteobacteria bacterium]